MSQLQIHPPKSWENLQDHYLTALQSDWYKTISKLNHEFLLATVDFYREKDIQYVFLPITTGSISSPMGLGSDSIPVKVNIDGIDTYLADSMQFFLEYACRLGGKGAYYIAPSFRGEKADARHLCQFYHSEAEIIGGLEDIMALCENYVNHLTNHFLNNCQSEIQSISGNTTYTNLPKPGNFPKCTFTEALKILQNNDIYIDSHDGIKSINSKGEKELIKHFGGYVWLTHFDHAAVPFYQKYDTKDHRRSLTADLLMGIGETLGCGERHMTGTEVTQSLIEHEVNRHTYAWYTNMKDLIPLQTAGFGMGVERFFLWLLNHDDIRDMQIVPRFNGIETTF